MLNLFVKRAVLRGLTVHDTFVAGRTQKVLYHFTNARTCRLYYTSYYTRDTVVFEIKTIFLSRIERVIK